METPRDLQSVSMRATKNGSRPPRRSEVTSWSGGVKREAQRDDSIFRSLSEMTRISPFRRISLQQGQHISGRDAPGKKELGIGMKNRRRRRIPVGGEVCSENGTLSVCASRETIKRRWFVGDVLGGEQHPPRYYFIQDREGGGAELLFRVGGIADWPGGGTDWNPQNGLSTTNERTSRGSLLEVYALRCRGVPEVPPGKRTAWGPAGRSGAEANWQAHGRGDLRRRAPLRKRRRGEDVWGRGGTAKTRNNKRENSPKRSNHIGSRRSGPKGEKMDWGGLLGGSGKGPARRREDYSGLPVH